MTLYANGLFPDGDDWVNCTLIQPDQVNFIAIIINLKKQINQNEKNINIYNLSWAIFMQKQ